jgi:hypothetical protein
MRSGFIACIKKFKPYRCYGASGIQIELATAFLSEFRALPANLAAELDRVPAIVIARAERTRDQIANDSNHSPTSAVGTRVSSPLPRLQTESES